MVSAENLNFSFGIGELSKQILFEVSLEIAAGEIVLLTGPSGSGKTTLLTLVGALRRVSSGRLRVFEQQLDQANVDELVRVRRKIGLSFSSTTCCHSSLPAKTSN
ncbi:MAG: ATP-binding cassette domain-containing protein [Planctomycetota bacterium]